jgi:tetratricopeptide (TPR) repeat protein
MSMEEDNNRIENYKRQVDDEQKTMQNLSHAIKTRQFKRPQKETHLTEFIFRQMQSEENKLPSTLYVTAKRHTCLTTDLNRLKKINLKEMTVNAIHEGVYLDCKSIVKPFYTSGINLLVQDNNGDVEHLVIYNMEPLPFTTDLEQLIPIGSKLLIKEPHLQMLTGKDFGIRVDSPTDLVITAPLDKNLSSKSVDQLVEEGNKAFGKSQLHTAIRFYTQAIEKSDKKSTRAYLNRAQCYIRLNKNYSAYQDASHVVNLEESNEKAHFRKGKSAYSLRKFDTAVDCFKTCLKLNPQNKEAKSELDRANQRVSEAKSCSYNFEAMYDQYFKQEDLYMDVADYKSDKIAIVTIENKSKGIMATDFIPKGTVLVVSKALSAVFNNKTDSRFKSYSQFDFDDSTYSTREETLNANFLAYQMQDNPELCEQVYSLFAGPEYNRNVKLDQPIVDFKRIEIIQKLNAFQIQNAFEVMHSYELNRETKKFKNYKDFREIELHRINLKSDHFTNMTKLQNAMDNLERQFGLWYLPSHFNHSCVHNCVIDYIGDVMIICASRDINVNEEVTIHYFPPEMSFKQRNDYAMTKYKFKCDCTLCQMDEQDDMREQREQVIYQIVYKNSSQAVDILESIADMETMRRTYINRPTLQFQMILPMVFLALKHRRAGSFKKSAKWFVLTSFIFICFFSK